MIKAMMEGAGLAPLAVVGLVVFVGVFVGVTAWALSRRRATIDRWASLPLADGTQPVEPRGPTAELSIVSTSNKGCGKCENCTC